MRHFEMSAEPAQRRGPDPLDGVYGSPVPVPKRKTTRAAAAATAAEELPAPPVLAVSLTNGNGSGDVLVPFEEALERERAAVLRLLPLDFLMSFNVAEQLLPRVAVFTVIVYTNLGN